jgi:hypothetical protein
MLSPALEGQTLRLKVTYTDAASFAETVFSAPLTVPFVNNGQARFSLLGTGSVGQALSVSKTQADPDGDGSVVYQWQAQASVGGAWQAISGASGASFVPAVAQQGQSLRLKLSYLDGQGFSETVYSGSVAVPAATITTPPPSAQPIFDPGGAIKPAVPTPSSPALKVSVAGSIWYRGLTAQITVTNTGTQALNGWSLTFDTTHQLSGAPWGANLSQQNLGGGLYRSTLSGKDWGVNLATGASVTVGLTPVRVWAWGKPAISRGLPCSPSAPPSWLPPRAIPLIRVAMGPPTCSGRVAAPISSRGWRATTCSR